MRLLQQQKMMEETTTTAAEEGGGESALRCARQHWKKKHKTRLYSSPLPPPALFRLLHRCFVRSFACTRELPSPFGLYIKFSMEPRFCVVYKSRSSVFRALQSLQDCGQSRFLVLVFYFLSSLYNCVICLFDCVTLTIFVVVIFSLYF